MFTFNYQFEMIILIYTLPLNTDLTKCLAWAEDVCQHCLKRIVKKCSLICGNGSVFLWIGAPGCHHHAIFWRQIIHKIHKIQSGHVWSSDVLPVESRLSYYLFCDGIDWLFFVCSWITSSLGLKLNDTFRGKTSCEVFDSVNEVLRCLLAYIETGHKRKWEILGNNLPHKQIDK